MKEKWQSFLDSIHFATDKSVKQRTLTLILIFAWAIGAVIAPYFINQTYTHALYSSVMSVFMLIILLLYVKKQWTFSPTKWSYDYSKILSNIGIGILAINMLYLLFPFYRIAPQPAGNLKEGTTYVVYREDCGFCQVANRNFNRAYAVYNATHGDTIRIIDMSRPTAAAQEVLDHVDHIGTIVYIDEVGEVHTDYYTLAGDTGKPIEPPVEYIYQTLKQIRE